MKRWPLLAGAALAVLTANGQPVPKDFEIPEPTVPSGSAVVITDDNFGGPRNVRVMRVPQPKPSASGTSAQLQPSAPKGEDCDAHVTAPKGSWDAMSQEKQRQRCLDRRAGVSTARPSAPATLYCRPNGFGGSTCTPY
jgi:hypothetical protein